MEKIKRNNNIIVDYFENGIKIYCANNYDDVYPQKVISSDLSKREKQILLLKNESDRAKMRKKYYSEKTIDIVDTFMEDINTNEPNSFFRGWIFPNGKIISQNQNSDLQLCHTDYIEIFLKGLEKFDFDSYVKIINLYKEYQNCYQVNSYILESFAVDVLEWIKIYSGKKKYLIYSGENWQDKLAFQFLTKYDFEYFTSQNQKLSDYRLFQLYDHIDEIIELGLQKEQKLILND